MKDTSNYGAGTLELLLVNAFTARSFVNKNGGMIPLAVEEQVQTI